MKKILIAVAILLLGSQGVPGIIYAEDNMGYSISATIPDNQIDKTLTYFDLKMEPNQKQEITLTVSNSSDQEQTIVISPNNATTNQNGVIDYSQSKGKIDSSLNIPLTSIISEAQEVFLAPNERKQVQFTLQMPEQEFNGTVLGGFYIAKKEDKEKDNETEKNVQIVNHYSYVIGIQLRETTEEVKPILKLNQIKPTLLNYRTAVTANLQNTEATKMDDLSIDAKIMKKSNSEVIHEIQKKNLAMAPNSNFNFPISWDNQSLEPGTYTLNLVARSGEQEWKFDKDFVISAKDSNLLNKEAVELEKLEPNWILISMIVMGLSIMLIVVVSFFIYRYQKKKAEEKRARIIKQRRRKKNQEIRKRKKTLESTQKKNTQPRKKMNN